MLALTPSGKVYGWGDNTFGQVGFQPKFGKDSKFLKKQTRSKTFYSPVLVYNPDEPGEVTPSKNKAEQIVAYNDTSFLLNVGQYPTEVYGWGRNENGLLCTK